MRKDGKYRVVDAFCGVGGATRGLQEAGFWVIGVDINPQPDYCGDEFVQMDAIKFLRKHRRKFDAAWASPPCQAHSVLTLGNRGKGLFDNHTDLIPATRAALVRTGKPWVMENVMGAPMRQDLMLCGLMFGLDLFRHRKFEMSGFGVDQPEHVPHGDLRVQGWRHGKFHEGQIMGVYGSGGGKGDLDRWQAAMGIDWTRNWHSLSEAVPPPYSCLIGGQMSKALANRT